MGFSRMELLKQSCGERLYDLLVSVSKLFAGQMLVVGGASVK